MKSTATCTICTLNGVGGVVSQIKMKDAEENKKTDYYEPYVVVRCGDGGWSAGTKKNDRHVRPGGWMRRDFIIYIYLKYRNALGCCFFSNFWAFGMGVIVNGANCY